MSDTARGEKPVLKQYFGASGRHPEACIEMSFSLPDRRFSLQHLARALEQSGYDLDIKASRGELALPEAIGALASALLEHPAPPRWSAGASGATGWICMSHFPPSIAATALLHCHGAIVSEDVPEAARMLGRHARTWRPAGEIGGLLMQAAGGLGLGVVSASPGGSVFQIGSGARGRHFFELANSQDSLTGQILSRDKLSTVEFLQRAGLPTTRAVSLWRADDALDAARRIGFPCVVKPRNRGKGLGVTARILSERHLAEAVEHAAGVSDYPLVLENHVAGLDHRMTVVDGKLLWVYRRTPPVVVGDGRATIRELIASENQRRADARKAQSRDTYLKEVVADPSLQRFIAENYGLTLESVPGGGRQIDLSGEANLARGGLLEDVTEQLHPDNRDMAVRVAQLFRMSALGIDFVTPDISRSWKEVPSAIIEVNSNPGISGHGDASLVLRTMLPFRLSGMVPSFVVIGEDDYQRSVQRAVIDALSRRKLIVGHGTYLRGNPRAPAGDPFNSVRSPEVEALLLDPRVEAVVVSSPVTAIEARGFPLGRCDVTFAAGTKLSDTMVRCSKRVVTDVLDQDAITRLVHGIVAPYQDGLGGIRPIVERIDVTDATGIVAILRCWRPRALPRARFLEHLAGMGAHDNGGTADAMLTSRDVIRAVERLARMHMRDAGQESRAIEFGEIAPACPWDTPCMDIPVSARIGQEIAMKSLTSAMDTVNALLNRLG